MVSTDNGRIAHLRSDLLPPLQGGEFYELWFVGEGDAAGKPNRISAGTFRPDSSGHTDVELTSAVDVRRFSTLAVTAERNDGRPGPTVREVVRGEAT